MKLEGIHHVTAITGDAPGNVDFYARVLGLRLVKKTVNQDDPTVYHLFYADERGSAGADITFFEYPGARRGTAGAGMVHRVDLPRRLRRGARLLGRAARRRGRRDAPRGRLAPASPIPRGSTSSCASSRTATSRSSRSTRRSRASTRCRASTASAPTRSSRTQSARFVEDVLGFERRGDGEWEVRGAKRGGFYALDRARGVRASAAPAPSTTSRSASPTDEHERVAASASPRRARTRRR